MVIDMKNLSINIKTEFILQLKNVLHGYFFLIEFILLFYSIELTRNELLFLIAENRIKISYEFPPFINSGMLFVLLFGSTIALLWGILNIHYDYKYKSHIIRSCLFDWANVLTSKAIIAFISKFIYFLSHYFIQYRFTKHLESLYSCTCYAHPKLPNKLHNS